MVSHVGFGQETRVSTSIGAGLLVCAALGCVAVWGCRPTAGPGSDQGVTVLAAASTAGALQEVVGLFEKSNPAIRIRLSTGASNVLAQQILSGAPADIFMPASKEWGDAIDRQQSGGDRVELMTNRLVLVVPTGNPANIHSLQELTASAVTRVALAGEDVPAGKYSDQALRSAGVADALQAAGKLVRGADVRAALVYVQRGEAEAGIVYATDATGAEGIDVVSQVDPTAHESVVYPAMLLRSAASRPAARAFFDFLKSSQSQSIFERRGFTFLLTSP